MVKQNMLGVRSTREGATKTLKQRTGLKSSLVFPRDLFDLWATPNGSSRLSRGPNQRNRAQLRSGSKNTAGTRKMQCHCGEQTVWVRQVLHGLHQQTMAWQASDSYQLCMCALTNRIWCKQYCYFHRPYIIIWMDEHIFNITV